MKREPSRFAKNKLFWVLGAVCAANFIAHLCVYPALPAVVPIHWGMDGAVNGWGPKSITLLLATLPAVLLLSMRFLPSMDPKAENYEKFKPIWNGFVVGTTVFISAISWLTEATVFGLLPETSALPGALVGGGIGLLFIVLGNYMPRIKQNYTFGCKTPWALADEHNWNRTHRMAGIVFVGIGIVLIICGIFGTLLGNAFALVTLGIVLGGTAWVYIYSFLVFRGVMK